MNPIFGAGGGGPRLLILGNSGSGKSTLAGRLGAHWACEAVSLDAIYWVDQASLRKRGQADAEAMARAAACRPAWVAEGVFGWLAEVMVARATGLIWLDLPWKDCRQGLMERGPQFGEDAAEFKGLLVWAEAYDSRKTGSSRVGHARIFDAFTGPRLLLTSRAEVKAFASGV